MAAEDKDEISKYICKLKSFCIEKYEKSLKHWVKHGIDDYDIACNDIYGNTIINIKGVLFPAKLLDYVPKGDKQKLCEMCDIKFDKEFHFTQNMLNMFATPNDLEEIKIRSLKKISDHYQKYYNELNEEPGETIQKLENTYQNKTFRVHGNVEFYIKHLHVMFVEEIEKICRLCQIQISPKHSKLDLIEQILKIYAPGETFHPIKWFLNDDTCN